MQRFAKAVEKHGGRRPVAERLGCSVEFVRLLLIEEKTAGLGKTPGLALAIKIKEAFRIPVTYWKHSSTHPDPTL